MESFPYSELELQEPSCLIVVDLQEQFINDNTRHVYPGIQKLQERFTYVVASRFIHEEGGAIHRWKKWQAALEGTPGAALSLDLSARDPDCKLLVEKSLFGAFSPDVGPWLKGKDIKEIHICGLDVDLCVVRTVFDVMEKGYRPLVLADLCATTAGEPLYVNALLQLKRLVGRDQVLFSEKRKLGGV